MIASCKKLVNEQKELAQVGKIRRDLNEVISMVNNALYKMCLFIHILYDVLYNAIQLKTCELKYKTKVTCLSVGC